ncbi:molybdopterin-binding protein [Streptomyces sp. NPDC048257]|uniref:molybdopterin-binding protein n=1 Tax=Streptomyces sp. NPDC048257 TaxID=3365526 RepID=UPI003722E7F4
MSRAAAWCDALGPLLPPLVAELGGESEAVRYVPDRPTGRLAGAVHGARDADVVVVTGSTSAGATDQLTRLVPVAWDGAVARIADGHRAAFLQGAAVGDALAAITPDWTEGSPAPLFLTSG